MFKTFPTVYKGAACSLALLFLTVLSVCSGVREQNLSGKCLPSVLPPHLLHGARESSRVQGCLLLSLGMEGRKEKEQELLTSEREGDL